MNTCSQRVRDLYEDILELGLEDDLACHPCLPAYTLLYPFL